MFWGFLVAAVVTLHIAGVSVVRSQFRDPSAQTRLTEKQTIALDGKRSGSGRASSSGPASNFRWHHLLWQVAATQASFAVVWLAVPQTQPVLADSTYSNFYYPNLNRGLVAAVTIPILECIVGNTIYSENQSFLEHFALSTIGYGVMLAPAMIFKRWPYMQYNFCITVAAVGAYNLLRIKE